MPEAAKYLDQLNPAQRAAVAYGVDGLPGSLPGPLLIVAGAGTGKTNTLAHRVAHLMVCGADPRRILLLTFTRRAADIMTRRAERIASHVSLGPPLSSSSPEEAAQNATDGRGRLGTARVRWAGTFHAIANRLLRQHASTVNEGSTARTPPTSSTSSATSWDSPGRRRASPRRTPASRSTRTP
jgi:DNA helicase-2/ATP-dependent DNA helicase PcrA